MRRVTTLVAVMATAALALTACGGGGSGASASSSASGAGAKSSLKVGLAYDIGGRGDQSFNDSAAEGLDKAKTEFGVQVKELEAANGETDAQKEERLRLLAEDGYNPIIAVGFAYATALKKVAAEFPEVKLRDRRRLARSPPRTSPTWSSPRTRARSWSAPIAAQASKTGNIGFIGGVNVPLIQKFQAGLRRRRQGREPRHQGAGQVPDRAAGLHRLRRPGQGQDRGPGHVRRRRRRHLRRRRRLRCRRLRGRRGREEAGPSVSTPTSTSPPPPR